MVLVPVEDAGQGGIVGQLFHGDFHSQRTKAQILGSLADAQHRHTVAGDVAMIAQHLCRILLTVIFRYHPQRGGTAVHFVELLIMGKGQILKHFTNSIHQKIDYLTFFSAVQFD